MVIVNAVYQNSDNFGIGTYSGKKKENFNKSHEKFGTKCELKYEPWAVDCDLQTK